MNSVPCMTGSSSSASKAKRRPRAGSSSPIRQGKAAGRRSDRRRPRWGRDESGKLTPLDVRAGDKVLFGKWSGTEVKIDGNELLIMKESDIMGIVG